jgi:hypothetical protein
MKIKWLIILSAFLVSCSTNETNNYVLSDDALIEVFCEIHLMDAAARQGVIKNNRNNFIKYKQYKAILLEHKIELNRFDSTLIYLSHNPDKFVELYEKVELRLIEKLKSYSDPGE